MTEKIQANDLLKKTRKSEKPIIVHQGGSSSGKTYAIMQHLLLQAASESNLVITVVGQDIPNLKVGAYRDGKNILNSSDFLKQELIFINKSDRVIEFNNGSIIEFNSYKDEQDAKSGKRTHAFFNEANGIPHGIFEQINMRTSEQTLIDFNPTTRFWAHNRLFGRKDVEWITSTFRDNSFINKNVKEKILSYKPTKKNIEKGTANEYRWKVYGLGEIGKLEGLVFPNVKTVEKFPEDYKYKIFGLDFGFTNDPTALIEIRKAHGQLYFRELIYKTGLTNQDICRILEDIDFDKTQEIIADSAEPKSIEELTRAGFFITPSVKGKDSINYGINLLKKYKKNVFFRSKGLIEEFESYSWKKNRTGERVNRPVDKFNHGIDAIRYAVINKENKRDGEIPFEIVEF